MAVARSIEAMGDGLRAAVNDQDWAKAHRHIDRLKAIILEAILRNDPAAIQSAGLELQSSGQLLELSKRLRMEMNEQAVAWQLRADAAMAAIAQRMRPATSLLPADEEDVSELLLKLLRDHSEPMTNSEMAARAAKDPATISRTLKRLKAARKIEQWKVGIRVFNKVRHVAERGVDQLQDISTGSANMKKPDECWDEIWANEDRPAKPELTNLQHNGSIKEEILMEAAL